MNQLHDKQASVSDDPLRYDKLDLHVGLNFNANLSDAQENLTKNIGLVKVFINEYSQQENIAWSTYSHNQKQVIHIHIELISITLYTYLKWVFECKHGRTRSSRSSGKRPLQHSTLIRWIVQLS